MADLASRFLGLETSSPIIVGSSGLTAKADSIVELAQAGAGAVVLKSLFEEQILASIAREAGRGGVVYGHGDVDEFVGYYERKHSIDDYYRLIEESKKRTSIPVVASVNAVSDAEWQKICQDIQGAGADAIQVNLFVPAFNADIESEHVESTYVRIVEKVKAVTTLPIAVKIGSALTNVARMVSALERAGADAVVLFNRYYSPDVDIEKGSVGMASFYSGPMEYLPSLRWTAIQSQRTKMPLVGATGIHSGETAVKFLLAGAAAVEVVSTVYRNGATVLTEMNNAVASWMDQKGHKTIAAFRGSITQDTYKNPEVFHRVQYMRHYGENKA